MSGIPGRSPFPSRSRRRLDMLDESNSSSSFGSSPFMLGRNLGTNQSKLSPTASYLSPTANSVSRRSTRRFFDENDVVRRKSSDGGVLATGIPSAAKMAKVDKMDGINITHLRRLVKEALGPSVTASPSMAVFYASMVYAKTDLVDDAYLYAQALSANNEARRCVRILDQAGMFGQDCPLEKRLEAVLLAAQSMANLGEWEEALRLLQDVSTSPSDISVSLSSTFRLEDDDDTGWLTLVKSVRVSDVIIHPIARICLWRGRCYDEMSHPPRATLFWKRALRIDAKCVEALDCLLGRNLLTPIETYELINSMTFDSKSDWLHQIYLSRIILPPHDPAVDKPVPIRSQVASFMNGHVDASSIHLSSSSSLHEHNFTMENAFDENGEEQRKQPGDLPVEKSVESATKKLWNIYKLDQSPEMLAMAAIRAYRQYNLQAAFNFCQSLTAMDPLCQKASFVHAATLLALDHKRLLFAMAHEWVEASPQAARSWFAVGCYYYACRRFHIAQQQFSRATRLGPLCTEAWIAFGCAFAACDESDQALASFRAAQRLAPAEHAAMLYIGMEYVRTNHLVLAQHSLKSALQSSGGDPLCMHELGVAAFQKREYRQAIQWFQKVIRTIACSRDPKEDSFSGSITDYIDLVKNKYWEPTLFNLGHCYRKTRKYESAVHCYERCLVLIQGNPSAFSALGFTRQMMGDYDDAIEMYHQALSRKPDDPFCTDMLNRAFEESMSVKLSLNEPRKPESVHNQSAFLRSPRELQTPTSRLQSPNSDFLMTGGSIRSYQRQNNNDMTFGLDGDINLSAVSGDVDMSMS